MTSRVSQFYDAERFTKAAITDLRIMASAFDRVGMRSTGDELGERINDLESGLNEMWKAFSGMIDDQFNAANQGTSETLKALLEAGTKKG